jgi:zinc protease
LFSRILFAICLLAGSAAADEPFPKPDIKEWKLPNGLDVIYLGVHRAPVVAVQVWYHVGSKEEPKGLSGSAHMFEHMMFKGTKNVRPEDHARLINGIGGVVNAFTREDVTAYHQTLPKQYLDFAVSLEAERMRGLLFRKEMVDTEREVVKEERRQRIESSPIGQALEKFRAAAFTRHPYSWLAIGSKEDLDRLTIADLKRFYDAYYQPNNASLIVVGDVTEDEVRQAAEKHFGKIPAAAEPPRPARELVEPPQTKLRKQTVSPSQLGVIIGGYHIPAAKSPDVYPLEVLAGILSGGESSRLFQRVVRKDGSGVFAGGQLGVMEDPGLFIVFGAFLAGNQADKVEKGILDEIARVAKEKVTDEELTKAKNQLTAGLVFGLQRVDGLADQIGTSKMLTGDARGWIDDYQKYQQVTAADVQRVAQTYLKDENLTLVVIPPAEAAKSGGGK